MQVSQWDDSLAVRLPKTLIEKQSGAKAEISQRLLIEGGTVRVQVLNELANVLRKKLGRTWKPGATRFLAKTCSTAANSAALPSSTPSSRARRKARRQLR